MDVEEAIVYTLNTDGHAIRNHLIRNGYVAIKVLSTHECTQFKAKFMTWLKSIKTRSWNQVFGIIKMYGIGQAPFMHELREHPCVQQAFRIAWNDYKNALISSYDGVCFHPANLSEQVRWWPHIDLHPQKHNDPSQITIQSSISLIGNMRVNDGGFIVWPYSHTLGLDFYKRKLPNVISNDIDYVPIPLDVANKLNKPKLIRVPAGTMIMWDSRLIHCNAPPGSKRNSHDRLVAFVCMVPKNLVSRGTLLRLEHWRKTGRTTSHSPIHPRVNPKDLYL